jgi:hypothetical protein
LVTLFDTSLSLHDQRLTFLSLESASTGNILSALLTLAFLALI